ncbi:MAG: hypothetical protein JWL59_650 [Chthoniobacteraceae bacterium]|nr:hypothetical protein [Chthoniobacteraceae bacterium]
MKGRGVNYMNIAAGREEWEQVHRQWGWFLALGLLLLLIGTIAISFAMATSIVTMVFFGSLLLATGVAQTISAYRHHATSGFWLQLLAAVLDIVVGGLIVMRPLEGALVFTLVLAALFFVGGIYRIAGAATVKALGWGWAVLSGVVDILLAVLLLTGWPFSGLWFIGVCLGIGLLFRGWAWVMFSLIVRKAVPDPSWH